MLTIQSQKMFEHYLLIVLARTLELLDELETVAQRVTDGEMLAYLIAMVRVEAERLVAEINGPMKNDQS